MVTLGERYLAAHARIVGLVEAQPVERLALPVAACPGWSVSDVVGHLTGVVEDALAGRISGPPDEALTAAEVARHRGRPIADVVADWSRDVETFAEAITAFSITAAVFDVISHEHDLRSALREPGARDAEAVVFAAARLWAGLDLGGDRVAVIELPDGTEVRSVGDTAPLLRLRTTPFEVLRLRLGRRTLDEMRALPWEPADVPAHVLDALAIFGPTTVSLGEG